MKYKGKTSEYYDGLDKRTREYKNTKSGRLSLKLSKKKKKLV